MRKEKGDRIGKSRIRKRSRNWRIKKEEMVADS
jgi:hypothetical protein